MASLRVVWYYNSITHRKIAGAIERMCAAVGCSLEKTTDKRRLAVPDYDLLVSPADFIDPAHIPPTVKAIVGPQLFVFPSGPVIGPYEPTYEKRYLLNCLSPWISNMWKDTKGSLRFPVVPLPTGVDTHTFFPSGAERDSYIVYTKHRSPQDIHAVKTMISRIPLPCKTFEYGSYHEADYLTALQRARFMIVVDAHESQGYALQEAMSCQVPLLVWDVTSMHDEYNSHGYYERHRINKSRHPLPATSIPWWSDICGIRVTKSNELPAAIDRMLISWNTFTPRAYILEHLSDEVCMRRWITAVGLETKL
jgi:hypothetical protein